jgi:hypothetical protein
MQWHVEECSAALMGSRPLVAFGNETHKLNITYTLWPVRVRVVLRLSVCQYVLVSSPFWDLRPDVVFL